MSSSPSKNISSSSKPSSTTPTPAVSKPIAASVFSDHADDQDDRDEADDDYPPVDPDDPDASLLPPPNFQPLFTVVTDHQTNESHHPSVYYVFSDDAENERENHDVTTVAALRALDQTAHKSLGEGNSKSQQQQDGIDERFVIIDLETAPEGSEQPLQVRNLSSLSSSWAVSSATLRPAPTFDEQHEESVESIMLEIQGVELEDPESVVQTTKLRKEDMSKKASSLLQEARKRGGGGIVQGIEEIWKDLNQGLSVLDQVVGNNLGEPPKEAE
jgi:hypothetical protein